MTRSRVLDRPSVVAWSAVMPRRYDVLRIPAPQHHPAHDEAFERPHHDPAPDDTLSRTHHDPAPDDAFSRTLYERHGTVLLNFALRLCNGDRYRAEDIVQETAVRAWQHRDILDPTTDRIRTWLFTVAHRLVIDHYRARQARPNEVGDVESEERTVPDPAERVVTLRAVLEAMTELTEQRREVLIYTYYLGYSVEQTAAVLGLAPGTVKSRAHYAMRALRASLRARAVMD